MPRITQTTGDAHPLFPLSPAAVRAMLEQARKETTPQPTQS